MVHRAQSEQEGRILVDMLAQHGIQAIFREPWGYAYDGLESLWNANVNHGIYVLEHLEEKASSLVQEFLAAPSGDEPDPSSPI